MLTDSVTGFYTLDDSLQRVKGWVLDPAEPASSQWVEILADSQVIAVLHANLDRADLARFGTGYTCYGFDFLLPVGDAAASGATDIEVRHKGSGTCLPTHSKSFQSRPVSQTTVPVREIDCLAEQEILHYENRVPIDSNYWHGDREFRDAIIGFNGKTARRVGKMRVREDGCWEYTKTVRYYRLRDALVIMPFGMVIADGCLIRGNLGFPHPAQVSAVVSSVHADRGDDTNEWLKTATEIRLRVVDGAVHTIDHPALLMSAPKYAGYNHWHVDVLPMLAGVERLPEGSFNHVISPGCPTPWHAASLKLAQSLYPGLEFSEFGELSILRASELIYTTGLAGNGCYLSPGLADFHEQLSGLVNDGRAAPGLGSRLYLSRRAYPRRALHNEAEIERTMESLGFQVIDPASFPYEEQVRLFRQADFIVSPHGAGLTNLLFSRPGVRVIELFADSYINLGLQRLANLKKARYGYLVGESSGGKGGAESHSFTYSIDAAALARLIEEM